MKDSFFHIFILSHIFIHSGSFFRKPPPLQQPPHHDEVNNNLNDSKFDHVVTNGDVVSHDDVVFRSDDLVGNVDDDNLDNDVTIYELDASLRLEVRDKVRLSISSSDVNCGAISAGRQYGSQIKS